MALRSGNRSIVVWEYTDDNKKPSRLTLFNVNVGAIILSIPLMYLYSISKPYPFLQTALQVILILVGMVFFITTVGGMVSHEPLIGRFKNKIIFRNDGFVLDNKFHSFKTIADIEIKLNHYKDEYIIRVSNPNPTYSNGVDNKISINIGDRVIEKYFQVNSKSHLISLFNYFKRCEIFSNQKVSYKGHSIRVKDFDVKRNIPVVLDTEWTS